MRVGTVSIAQSTTNSSWNVGVHASGNGTATIYNVGISGYIGVGLNAVGDAIGVRAECNVPSGTGDTAGLWAIHNNGGWAIRTQGSVLVTNGFIQCAQDIIAYSSSDIRLKENIERLQNPLVKLRKLGGYEYDWKASHLAKFANTPLSDQIKKHDVGVIAQEVLSVLPEAVNTREDGILAVNYEKLIPLIIEAILELDRKIK